MPQIETVLVIDDDDNFCFLTRLLLQDAGVGKRVITAGNGLEAIKKLRDMAAAGEKLPELIFLDIKMPVMDGFEFLDQLAGSPELSLHDTRIFMSTSSFLPRDKERASHYPIAGFLTKPLTEESLDKVLR
ncbi:MAG: response regulator [Cytophagales bacterium]|nr:response regulator [Cytophagales bacterium]